MVFFYSILDFVTYILASEKTANLYKGHTSNLIGRFKSHNGLSKKGWTVRYRPWRVVYVRFFATKSEAMGHEHWLKSGAGREWIKDHQKAL
ncbi:GIY-YIG nuclease family protein [Subsaximicrobium wynnwilliamsii]|uniref:GIY-YIG nuclease family protein n=1 Tax=Subsaximicrobium wynnwilliamsii TaxID=291179 RepID=UPI002938F534|nr:GIY-YIG nuclease family protein [Subsaximicrobium wynnwilliamsii]